MYLFFFVNVQFLQVWGPFHAIWRYRCVENTHPGGRDLRVSSLLSDSGQQSGALVHRAAWFIPTDCPQLLQLPEPRPGMHGWGQSTNTPQNRGWWNFRQKWQIKRDTLCHTAGAANKMSPNASLKERPGKTARWKSQPLIWVGINQLGRRFPAPLIGPCSPDDRDEDYYCPKVDTKIREAFWRRSGDVPLLQNIILPLQWGLQQNHNESSRRRPNADRVMGTAAITWHLLMRPTCGQTAHSAAEPQHWRSSGLRELRRGHRLEQIWATIRTIKSH